MKLYCPKCGENYELSEPVWRCVCGSFLALTIANAACLKENLAISNDHNFWRYNSILPFVKKPIKIGESMTPLTSINYGGKDVLLKMDYLLPTGSYKDRGVAPMVSVLKQWGLCKVVEDSSGNAGSSVAAYCNKANISCDVYIPAYTSLGKAAQISLYGANLIKVKGSREDTRNSAFKAGEESFYASHNWSPFFEHGVKTYIYEIWEQMGFTLPDFIISPCGNGSLITSAYIAFLELKEAGLIKKIPKIVAVQTENCAPLARAWQEGKTEMVSIIKKDTVAEGIASSEPLKHKEIIDAVNKTSGIFVTVSDAEVWSSLQELAKQGIFVEPTSATAPAAFKKLFKSEYIKPHESVVIELTGNGLKATDKILKHLS